MDEEIDKAFSNYSAVEQDSVAIRMRPGQFVRFQIERDNAGFKNSYKDMRVQIRFFQHCGEIEDLLSSVKSQAAVFCASCESSPISYTVKFSLDTANYTPGHLERAVLDLISRTTFDTNFSSKGKPNSFEFRFSERTKPQALFELFTLFGRIGQFGETKKAHSVNAIDFSRDFSHQRYKRDK
jgi:hypothetical protein